MRQSNALWAATVLGALAVGCAGGEGDGAPAGGESGNGTPAASQQGPADPDRPEAALESGGADAALPPDQKASEN